MNYRLLLPLMLSISLSAEETRISEQKETKATRQAVEPTNVDKAIEFFKAYVYAPSTKILTSNVLDKLEIKDILKLLDDRIYATINRILDLNKDAQSIYVKNGDKDQIRAIYMDMSNQYDTLHQVESRVRALYPEPHMHKLFDVLQKIYAKQYQITYNPEEDKKSFWDVFVGA